MCLLLLFTSSLCLGFSVRNASYPLVALLSAGQRQVHSDPLAVQLRREDGLENLSALHDVVNITIGETNKAHNPQNLTKFVKKANAALDACTNCHEVE